MTRQMTPKEAAERYLKERGPDVSDATLYNHRSLLRQWWNWCEDQDIEYVNDIDGFDLADFRLDRQLEVGEVTLYNQMTVLRVFVRWLQSRGLVQNGLADGMTVAQPDDASRNRKITADTAQQILSYLKKYEYASLRHSAVATLWHSGMRLGALRSIDLDDYHPEDHYVELCHRPETGTPLKNKEHSEREVNLAIWCCSLLDNYIEGHRHEVTDDYGRSPLFTTEQGRVSHSNVRDHINQVTRPCDYTNECPHNREIIDCEATTRLHAARCPSSIAPHDLRRSSVTHLLDEGHRKELVADRVDLSVRTMEEHYDKRSEAEKRQLRRDEFGMNI